MSRPTEYPVWASNINYATGPDIGTLTRVEPSTGYKQDGDVGENEFIAQYENWIKGMLSDWVQWLDSGSVAATANLTSLADLPDGTIVRVNFGNASGVGYRLSYAGIPAVSPDGYWLVTATVSGHANAMWVHPNWNDTATQATPAIGPVPGEIPHTNTTPAGRINPDYIHYGYFEHFFNTHSQFNTTSGSTVTLSTLANLGALKIGDVIEFRANCTARGNSAADFDFQVWVEISEDNGGTWTNMSNAGNGNFRATATNDQVSIPLSFFALQVNNNTSIIRLRAISDGTHQIIVDLNSWVAEVRRP